MLSFEYPYLAVLWLLPIAVYWLLPPNKSTNMAALLVPDSHPFIYKNQSKFAPSRQLIQALLRAIIYILLVLAVMRPVWLQDAVAIKQQGRDLMLAIDLSGSMDRQDMQYEHKIVSRIWLTKKVAAEFVEKRQGDRLGLIVFGAFPYLQTPLSFDRNTIIENIKKSYTHDADDIQNRIFGTSIGDAIGLAIKRLQDNGIEQKTLILITDGSDNSSNIPPAKAAELAQAAGLKIYTIGLGSDRYNNIYQQELDEDILRYIAKTTGGSYFRARHADELSQIYAQIDQLEPVKSDSLSYRPQQSLYYYPLLLAMLLALSWLWRPLLELIAKLRNRHVR